MAWKLRADSLENDDFSRLTGGFRCYGYHYVIEPGKLQQYSAGETDTISTVGCRPFGDLNYDRVYITRVKTETGPQYSPTRQQKRFTFTSVISSVKTIWMIAAITFHAKFCLPLTLGNLGDAFRVGWLGLAGY